MSQENGGSLIFKLGLWTKEFEEKYVATEKKLSGIGAKLNNAFSIAQGAAVIGFMNHLIDRAGALQDTAEQLDISAESMQALDHRAREAGISANTLANAYNSLKSKAADAAQGNKQVIAALQRLGIDTQTFINLKADRQLEAVAKAYAAAEDKSKAYAAVVDILGNRNAPRLNAILKQLAEEGLDGIIAGSTAAGQVMDASLLKRMDQMGDSIANLKNGIQNFATKALVQFTSGLGYIAADIANTIDGISTEWHDADLVVKQTTASVQQVTVAMRGAAATSEELKRFEEARATAAEKRLTIAMDTKQKILFYEDKIMAATVESSKWEKETKEWIAAQNDIIKAQGELDQLRIKRKDEIADAEKKAADELKRGFAEDLEWVKKQDAARKAHQDFLFTQKTATEQISELEGRIVDARKAAVGDAEKQVELDKLLQQLGELRQTQAEKIAAAAERARIAAEGHAEAAKRTQQAYEAIMFGITNGGRSNEDIQRASPEAIAEAIRRNNQALIPLRQKGANMVGANGDGLSDYLTLQRLENENRRLQAELDYRNGLRRDVETSGIEGARRRGIYDPFAFDRLVSEFVTGQSEQQKTNTLLEDIQRRLAPAQGNGLLDSVQAIESKLDSGLIKIAETIRAQSGR